MLAKLLAKIFGTRNERELQRLKPLVNRINELENTITPLTDDELGQKTNEFREKISRGATLDDILPEAFAVVRETARRTLNQRHFDVQLIGGIVLHQGRIAEMKTGEGKTLTATLPLYLNALMGKGAHLVTVNDYLARRDAEWMSPIFRALGLSIGIIQNALSDQARKAVYQSDVIYATNNELGFDYLRDNMKFKLEDYVQRPLHYAIVDEVDSILIDEARTPLIISGPTNEGSRLYAQANAAITGLTSADYDVDEKQRSVQFTESGNDKIEAFFKISNLYAMENLKLLHLVSQALRAHTLFKRDVHYIVKDNQVLIVDEFTGRILPGRRYSDGVHQAIEAKEGVKIERETQTLASITLQNLFRLYTKLSGMTGTAVTEAEEFIKIYNLDVLAIPTNEPLIREDKPDLIYLSKNAKYKNIAEDVKERHVKGQPTLIGTVAVETSEYLSVILTKSGVPHEVLNAKNHAREAEIVAHAGEPGRVTIATNMAGRGTDIKLTSASIEAGGLYILGTERHESRRIDDQLRGRSGRQGDPGESRFYISLEDDLIRIFAGETMKERMQSWAGMTEDDAIESRSVSRIIENAQEKIEKQNFEVRRQLLEYDDVLNQQRTVVYQLRREVLESEEEITGQITDAISQAIQFVMAAHIPGRDVTDQERETVLNALSKITALPRKDFDAAEFSKYTTVSSLTEALDEFLRYQYESRVKQIGTEEDKKTLYQHHKWTILDIIDTAWKQHMLNLDHLKEGIGLRGYGQKNPLIEYKREAFVMFEDMIKFIRLETVHLAFHRDFGHFNQIEEEKKRQRELDEMSLMGPDSPEANVQIVRAEDKVGRNDPCPCGSEKKYKKCCILNGE